MIPHVHVYRSAIISHALFDPIVTVIPRIGITICIGSLDLIIIAIRVREFAIPNPEYAGP